ncbi:MAG: hypothetical protein PVS3B3_09400 [Ktedonobacteraceae bacterium]
MKALNRRRFLQLASASSVAVAAGTAATVPALTSASQLTDSSKQGTFTFRAIAGLPSKAMPAYASYVIEGHVNLTTGTGVMTRTLFAGAPGATSTVAFPGLSRIIRIHDIQNLGGAFHLKGVVDDRSLLQRGESPNFEVLIDPAQKRAKTNYLGTEIIMQLEG